MRQRLLSIQLYPFHSRYIYGCHGPGRLNSSSSFLLLSSSLAPPASDCALILDVCALDNYQRSRRLVTSEPLVHWEPSWEVMALGG